MALPIEIYFSENREQCTSRVSSTTQSVLRSPPFGFVFKEKNGTILLLERFDVSEVSRRCTVSRISLYPA